MISGDLVPHYQLFTHDGDPIEHDAREGEVRVLIYLIAKHSNDFSTSPPTFLNDHQAPAEAWPQHSALSALALSVFSQLKKFKPFFSTAFLPKCPCRAVLR